MGIMSLFDRMVNTGYKAVCKPNSKVSRKNITNMFIISKTIAELDIVKGTNLNLRCGSKNLYFAF